MVVTPVAEGISSDNEVLGLILVRDAQEVLISESLDTCQAQASWTQQFNLTGHRAAASCLRGTHIAAILRFAGSDVRPLAINPIYEYNE